MSKPRVRVSAKGWTRKIVPPKPAVSGFRAQYDAAGSGKRASGWDNATNEGPASMVARQLDTMRNRNRFEFRNNPALRRVSDFLVTSIVNDGLKPNLKGFNDPVFEKRMSQWMEQCDADEINTFFELQALATREMIEGGENFSLKRPRNSERDKHLSVPLQVQLLSGEFCPTWDVDDTSKSGIVFGGPGRRSAYKFYKQHPGEYLHFGSPNGWQTETWGADFVAHLYDKRNIGQIRGVPWSVAGLLAAHDLDAYLDAALVRQKLNAMVTWWVETPNADVGQDAPDGYDENGDPIDENGDPWEPTDIVDLLPDLLPGSVNPLPPGYKVTPSAPTEVGGQFDVFTRRQLQRICDAFSVPYELVFDSDGGANERFARLRHLKFYAQVRQWRRVLVSHFCKPTWSWAVDALAMNTDWKPVDGKTLDDYKNIDWIGSPPEHIYPKQEIETDILAIENRLKSPSQVIIERGGDPDAVFKQWAEDDKIMRNLGIKPEAFKSMIDGVSTSAEDSKGR